jgi:hypothetical protein
MAKIRAAALGASVALVVGVSLPLVGSIPAAAAGSISYHFPSPPIAPAGSIGPGQSLTFSLRVQQNGQPFPGGQVYLSWYQGEHVTGDSTTLPASQCGGVSTLPGSGSVRCTADALGNVALTYNVPAQPPVQGQAGWTAQSSSSGGSRAVDHYVYSTEYRFNPSPIAPSGSLAAGASVPVTLTTDDAIDQPVANSFVYLSFKAAAGGGSASVGSTPLTSTPTLFNADGTGSVNLTYTAPLTLPSSGLDSIIVQDRSSSAKETTSASYAFDPSTPVISVGDVTVVEGDQQPGIPADFTVTISPVQANPVTVQYISLCGIGDKECSEDFRQITSPVTVTIPAGHTSATALVRQYSYVGANEGETYNEGWFVLLSNPSVGLIGRAIGEGTLLPDVESGGTIFPYLYTGSAGAIPTPDAGGVPLMFTVTLGGLQSSDVTFSYATLDGTALAGTNYMAALGTATIGAGKSSVVIKVMLMPQAPPGSSLQFTLNISGASGGLTISGPTGTGTVMAAGS